METMENIRLVIYLGIIVVVASYFVTHITNAGLINRKNCPLEDEWNQRATEVCKSQPEHYHCMYNTSCKLVEFCRKEMEYNNFEIYFNDSTLIPFIEKQHKRYTNSMDYWIIQDILHCKTITWIPITEKPMISSTTGQPSTTCDNGEDVYFIPFIIASVVGLVGLVVSIGLFIYIKRSLMRRGHCINRNGNNETPTDMGKEMEIKNPTLATEETAYPGGTMGISMNPPYQEVPQNSDLGGLLQIS